jgi:alpha-galactosidase
MENKSYAKFSAFFTAVLLLFSTVFFVSPSAEEFSVPYGLELVPNGGLELPVPTNGAGSVVWSAFAGERSRDFAAEGGYSLKVESIQTAGGGSITWNGLPLENDSYYKLSMWVKAAECAGSWSFNFRFGGNGPLWGTVTVNSKHTEFVYVERYVSTYKADGFVNANTGEDLTLGAASVLNLRFGAALGDVLYVDNLSCVKVGGIPVAGPGEEMLRDAGFEDFLPNSFIPLKSASANQFYTEHADGGKIVSSGVHSGNQAVKIGDGGSVYSAVELKAGVKYEVSVWMKTGPGAQDGNNFYLAAPSVAWADRIQVKNVQPGSDYVKLSCYITPSVDIAPTISFNDSRVYCGSTYEAYVDDFSVKQCGLFLGLPYLEKFENGEWSSASRLDVSTGLKRFTVSGINNNSAADFPVAAIIGLYNGSRLVNVSMAKQLFTSGSGGDLSVELNIGASDTADSGGEYAVKTFIWNPDTLTPYKAPPKILFVGNSITAHGRKESIGWYADCGMAASERSKDYVHTLASMLREDMPDLEMDYVNIAATENAFWNYGQTLSIPSVTEKIKANPDVIVFAIGANIGGPQYSEGHIFDVDYFKGIVDTFNETGRAKVVVGVTTLTGGDVSAVLKAYAELYGCPYVDMNFTPSGNPEYFPASVSELPGNPDPNVVTSGVFAHPGDAGMAEMANRLYLPVLNAFKEMGRW